MASTIRRGFFNKFNRGEVSPDAFAREDVTRIDNSCELMKNFMPERLGPMSFRPGAEAFDRDNNGIVLGLDDETWLVAFPTSVEDPVLLIFAVNGGLPSVQFIRNFEHIIRTAVTSVWTNGDFSTSSFVSAGNADVGLGWADISVGGSSAVISSGRLRLRGTGTDEAKAYQTTGSTEASAAHGFFFVVDKGEVLVQIGTGGQDSADLFEGFFQIGYHHIEIDAPASGDLTVTLSNSNLRDTRVLDANIVGNSNIQTLLEDALRTSILNNTANDVAILRSLRWAQSADVMYFAGGRDVDQGFGGWLPFEIRRWNPTSFSVQRFVNVFGPYEPINITNVTMEPTGAVDGNMTVQPSRPYFEASPPGYGFGNTDYGFGTLLKIAIDGQRREVTGSTNGTATLGIFVFGTGNARRFTVDIDTTGSYNRIELQKSFDEITWQNVKNYTGGGDVNEVFDDELDAAETFYRLEIVDVGAASTITMFLDYSFGTLESQGRVVENDNNQDVEIEWFVEFSGDAGVEYPNWFIGSWGGKRGMPTAVAFHEGRLWFAGGNTVWASESDFYESFDTLVEGDSASIRRTIGFGAAQDIYWLAPSARLVAGTAVAEIDIRSSAFGEVLTPTNTNLKAGSDLGVANIPPVVIDNEIFFIQRGGDKLISIDFNLNSEKHSVEDFNMLNQDILVEGGGVVQMAFARNPETRIYCVMNDGTMRILNRDFTEGVLGWSRLELVGNGGAMRNIVSVAVLPGLVEDEVYVTTSQQQLYRFAPFRNAKGASDSRHFDNFLHFTSPGTTITLPATAGFGVGNLVAVWVDGVDDGDYTINGSNQITGVTSGTDVTVGFRYTATYLSNKLSDYDDQGVLLQRKRVINTALMMRNYVVGGVTIGPSLSDLGNMPAIEDGKAVVAGTEDYDRFPFVYRGTSETDPRIAISANQPVKILGYAYDVKNTASKTRTAS